MYKFRFPLFQGIKSVLAAFLIFVFSLNTLYFYPDAANAAEIIGDNPPQCGGINESALRGELNRIIQDYLSDQSAFDVKSLVDRQWNTLNLDAAFDTEIDQAIAVVTSDAGLVNRFKSSWIPSQAETLANQVTEKAFKSEGLNRKLDQLSRNVADQLADQLELISAQSSSYAMDCLQRFINRQYSQTFVDIFGKKIQGARADSIQIPDAFDANTQSFLKTHQFAFGGAAVVAVSGVTRQLIGKKIISRITQQVVERIAGRLGTGFIPVVGEIIGGVMLTSDVINSFDGALPEIQASLKEPEIKQTFREKITYQIDEELRNESSQIVREISNNIYAEWLDFQKDYRDTLNLAAALPQFKDLLVTTTDVSKVSALVGIALNNMGRSQLIEAIETGDFERSLSLPQVTYAMLETTHDLHTLIRWTNLAGNQVDEVVRLELYKHLSPQDLDRKFLREILALQDDTLIAKLALLDIPAIKSLLAIAKPNLIALSANLSSVDLNRLSTYLGNLDQPDINELVRFIMDDPAQFKGSGIEYLIQSQDLKAAIQFWNTPMSVASVFQGALTIVTGKITWKLFAAKYGTAFLILVVSMPVLLIFVGFIFLIRQLVATKRTPKSIEAPQEQKS